MTGHTLAYLADHHGALPDGMTMPEGWWAAQCECGTTFCDRTRPDVIEAHTEHAARRRHPAATGLDSTLDAHHFRFTIR